MHITLHKPNPSCMHPRTVCISTLAVHKELLETAAAAQMCACSRCCASYAALAKQHKEPAVAMAQLLLHQWHRCINHEAICA
jgi:hypothetical protein